jgi:uncharacterized protein HemX
MRREAGVSVVAVVAVLAVLAAGGAGYFAWQNGAEIERLQSELNTTKTGMDKARADLKKAAQELAAASKDAKEFKAAADRLITERDQVRTSMENAQANGDRLRAELALAKDQISYLSARSSKDVVRGMPKVATSR